PPCVGPQVLRVSLQNFESAWRKPRAEASSSGPCRTRRCNGTGVRASLPKAPCPSGRKRNENELSQTLSRTDKQHEKNAHAIRLTLHLCLRGESARFVPARRSPSRVWSRRARPLRQRLAWQAWPRVCSDALARPGITRTKRPLTILPTARWR